MKAFFRTLAVPVDGSETSDRGVAFAVQLAANDGRIAFCSVIDPLVASLPVSEGVAAYDPAPMLAALEDDAARYCRHGVAAADEHRIANDATTLHGPCIEEIVAFAATRAADAIVIGTHGRSGVARVVLGSVAEGVLRRSSVPVVTVHTSDDLRTGPLLVAFDASLGAQSALALATALASARTMRLLILAVAPSRAALDAHAALVSEAVRCAERAGVEARGVVGEGNAADAITAAADSYECCMIVMGTHGRAHAVPLLLGRTAASVVEHARVPVVTFRN